MPHKTILLVQSFRQYPHTWDVGLLETVCSEPCCLLGSCLCFPCANYKIRKEAMNHDTANYRCFQGYYCGIMACCCPCQSDCGACCLAGESILCPHLSVMATRHLVQEKYNVKNTCCENSLINCVLACECLMCCVDDDSCLHDILHCTAHAIMCVAMPCMQAQAHHQMRLEENTYLLAAGGPPSVIEIVR